ncbi:hypothetical protein [Streptomyces crystallinus]|uniref:Uncharacterized protein n=1 Tax=Streptomyces crystallinus TaxID=68191 RepID=A0ABN1GIL0_9ACTN
MILRTTLVYVIVPLYFALLIASIRARRTTAAPSPCAPMPFWRAYLRSCAAFPLGCLILIGLSLVFPGRLP